MHKEIANATQNTVGHVKHNWIIYGIPPYLFLTDKAQI